jgi:hypothetical protein|tara:strand:- start:16234 stop:17895 length:1662 start_codon:yes stop_codon:yes gene_type:complete
MAIKRYVANADTTITNAFKENLITRGTASNMGRADSLEVFSIYGQESSGSSELSRILVQFPTTDIATDRTNGTIPASGSVSFYLRMFNAVTPFTVPRNFTLVASAVSGANDNDSVIGLSGKVIDFNWQEGQGIDADNYTDVTRDGEGANWIMMGSSSVNGPIKWGKQGSNTVGGAFFDNINRTFTQTFDSGVEDLEINITNLVEQWVNSTGNVLGTIPNYGIGIFLTASQEAYVATADQTTVSRANDGGSKRSYYTKKFFARSSEFFYKRPIIEARWDSAEKDDRGNFYYSSSLATAGENLNTVYLYNYFRGQLRNIPEIGSGPIYVSVFSGSTHDDGPGTEAVTLVVDGANVQSDVPTVVTGGHISTGIYTASFAITASSPKAMDTIYDVWFKGGVGIGEVPGVIQYQTGTIEPKKISLQPQNPSTAFVSNITNLRPVYSNLETARFRIFTRQKNWYPSIYTRAVSSTPPFIVESGSYAVTRVVDDFKAIQFGTGSNLHTQMSFDISGSYFDLDMSMLEPGYAYKIKLAFYNGSIGSWQEQPQEFKFRVEEG